MGLMGVGCDRIVVDLEVSEFKEWYMKFRDIVSDLTLVRRVSTMAYNLLNAGCSRDEVVKVIKDTLASLNIDPSLVKRGEFQGMREDVKDILREVFPNAVQETRTPFFTQQGRAVKVERTPYGEVQYPARRGRLSLGVRRMSLGEYASLASIALGVILAGVGGAYRLLTLTGIGISIAIIGAIAYVMARLRWL